MRDTTALIDKVKGSMRILSKSAVIENDINGSIEACKRELSIAGVKNIDRNRQPNNKGSYFVCEGGFQLPEHGGKVQTEL